MNTVIFEDEMEEAYALAKRLHEMDVDALIIQDLGLLHLLHHRLPDLVLHASTQLSVSKPNMIEKLKQLGVSAWFWRENARWMRYGHVLKLEWKLKFLFMVPFVFVIQDNVISPVFDMIAVEIVVCVLNHVVCHILCIKIMLLWAKSFII